MNISNAFLGKSESLKPLPSKPLSFGSLKPTQKVNPFLAEPTSFLVNKNQVQQLDSASASSKFSFVDLPHTVASDNTQVVSRQLKFPEFLESKAVASEQLASRLRPQPRPASIAGKAAARIESLKGMTPRAQELLTAMNNYEKIIATPEERREIAIELDAAAKAFDVDPKMMLAVFAHESGGIKPTAKSHTGAKGLGQLTGIAIKQTIHMAKNKIEPYAEHKSTFEATQKNRYSIKGNIWTSTAYMNYELKYRNNGNIKRSLERYGDPNIKTYENKVAKEFKTLFGKDLF